MGRPWRLGRRSLSRGPFLSGDGAFCRLGGPTSEECQNRMAAPPRNSRRAPVSFWCRPLLALPPGRQVHPGEEQERGEDVSCPIVAAVLGVLGVLAVSAVCRSRTTEWPWPGTGARTRPGAGRLLPQLDRTHGERGAERAPTTNRRPTSRRRPGPPRDASERARPGRAPRTGRRLRDALPPWPSGSRARPDR